MRKSQLPPPIHISPEIAQKLMENESELNEYLKYIRYKQPIPKFNINTNILKDNSNAKETTHTKGKKEAIEIRPFIEYYFRLIRQINGLENCMGKKIMKKILQFLQEFPSISFLLQVANSFGKEKKKICFNEQVILNHATDDMIPLFNKIIEKIENLKKEAESKKLMELGHRIEHLNHIIISTKHKVRPEEEHTKIFKSLEPERVENYIVMEENINKAEKDYGNFSQNFIKNKEIFSNINKVCQQIKSTHEKNLENENDQ